jgi:hypothetical protein
VKKKKKSTPNMPEKRTKKQQAVGWNILAGDPEI